MPKKRKWIKRTAISLVLVIIIGAGAFFCIDSYVVHVAKKSILTLEEAAELQNVDCILVLGCGVKDDGAPSDMLYDRLMQGVELYDRGASDKLLMSGDHGREDYDEVNTMKKIAVEHGIKPEDIFMDHAGFSTYESMYRAKDVFMAKKIIIVTQEYHLYRAIYVAESLGIDASGVASNPQTYYGQAARDFREKIARNKDFFYTLIKPKPTFLGEAMPVGGNGNSTNDK